MDNNYPSTFIGLDGFVHDFLADTRLEARDALADIVKAYDSLTDYERMVMPEAFRMEIEKGRGK